MANIRVDVDYQIVDGQPLTFKAPCPCSEADGLTVYYAIGEGKVLSKTFTFKDAHGNDLTNVNDLFDANAYVKVVLNIKDGFAYLQNADTNAYLEGKFEEVDSKLKNTHPIGSVVITSTNTNPGSELGGRWILIDKEFEYGRFNGNSTQGLITRENITTIGSIVIYTIGHKIVVDGVSLETTVDLEVNEKTNLFEMDLTKVGLSGNIPRFGGCIAYTSVFNDMSTMNKKYPVLVEFGKKVSINNSISNEKLPAGSWLEFHAEAVVGTLDMNDSYCDKFYWKRTA